MMIRSGWAREHLMSEVESAKYLIEKSLAESETLFILDANDRLIKFSGEETMFEMFDNKGDERIFVKLVPSAFVKCPIDVFLTEVENNNCKIRFAYPGGVSVVHQSTPRPQPQKKKKRKNRLL